MSLAPLAQPRCGLPVEAVEVRARLGPGQRRAVIHHTHMVGWEYCIFE